MDEKMFRAPEPEDNALPQPEAAAGAAAGGPDREDGDLPGEAYIEHASAMFNFTAPEEEDRRTRVVQTGSPEGPVPPASPAVEKHEPRYALGAPAADGVSPTPPWLGNDDSQGSGSVPVPGEDADPPVPATPDETLLPEPSVEAGKDGQTKRLKWIVVGLCALIVLLTGAVIFILWGGNADKTSPSGFVAVPMPQTAAEIADFYKKAVDAVKQDGAAGYRRKAWQTISELNLTGIAFVDDIISGVFDDYVTPAENAKAETYTKGTEFAKARFPGFGLDDYSVIRSAECTASGSNYLIKLVFDAEDTPNENDSFLGKVTDTVFFWDTQIEPILADISQLKAYSDVHVRYHDLTVTAEISAEGRFVSLKHTVPADVDIGSARISIFTFTDKYLHFESTAEYTDFVY